MKRKMHLQREHRFRRCALIRCAQLFIVMMSILHNTCGNDDYSPNFDASNMFGAPLITPIENDITVEVRSNYTLTCESNELTTWHVPDVEFGLEYEIIQYKTNDPNRQFANQLKLYNISVHNVGYYYCVNDDLYVKDTEIEQLEDLIVKFKASKIYVFVNDPNNLILPNVHPVITAYQLADVIIPCKPTSKSIEVELVSAEDESRQIDHTGRYDPTIGFIYKIFLLSDGGLYICRPKNIPDLDSNNQIYFTISVLSDSRTEFINKPLITSESGGHAAEGENIILWCSIEVRVGVIFSINWILPNDNIAKKEQRVFIQNATKESHSISNELEIGKSQLIVRDVNREKDSGFYKCEVIDHSDNRNSEIKLITILHKNESYINISEPSSHYKITTSSRKKHSQFWVNYRGYPLPIDLIWYDNQNREITPNNKFTIERTDEKIVLKITNLELKDTGDYYLRASNNIVEKELKFTLNVKEKPTVTVENVYVQAGEETKLTCECAGFPKSVITWTFTPCAIRPKWPTCASTRSISMVEYVKTSEETHLLQKSELTFRPTEPGIAKCIAKNEEGNDETEAEVLIGDLIEPFTAYINKDNNNKIAVGDNVVITCGALAYNYSADINWYRDNNPVENNDYLQVVSETSAYSYRKILQFNKVGLEHTGQYECRANLISDIAEPESKMVYLQVHEPEIPTISTTNLDGKELDLNLGELLRLECKFSGIPEPTITWYKDDVRIESNTNQSRTNIHDYGTVLSIPFIKPEDEGVFKCLVENRIGKAERSAQVKISNMPGLKLGAIIAIAAVIIGLIIFIIFLCIRIIRQREHVKQMKAAGLANFEEGGLEYINPALSLDEQADLLPYDRRFEFSKDKLKLGKQLGAGAFGVVLKATAEGIIPDERETTVAVKMVKKTADNEVMKALVSELKIMVHLGQHLNVVNLLGAVTKNIAKREVMVIVEYCRYGNVQNFLLKNRKRFINQINPDTDLIDPSITTQEQSKMDGDRKSDIPSGHPNSKGYIQQSDLDYIGGSNMDSCNTEQTLINTAGDEGLVLSNNSVQPAWRSNYRPDCTTAMDINTTHLLSWAFQVARGMDYLASRKVLHGDLAARNILLCDDNVVKICDFGLARSMYRSDNYKKQGEAPLPIKWLALESLGDQVFSTYSDIWSYGIVLWEFFSLAKVPYPGMEADQKLYLKLKDGYRMEKPQFANQELYDIMLQCWSANPEARPPFSELERRFSKLLEDDVTNHYIDLNEPYLRINSEYYKQGQTDYLALMGVPEEAAPQAPAPRYVNGSVVPEIKIGNNQGEYLHMSPKSGNAIFSPRAQDDYVRADHFDFPKSNSPTISNNLDSPSSKNRKKSGIPEEIPMLKQTHSDSEAEPSPDPESVKTKFSNLNKSPNDFNNKIIAGNDNYVNIQSVDPDRKMAPKDAFSNPGYLMLTTVNERK